jgi:hypothetical protein
MDASTSNTLVMRPGKAVVGLPNLSSPAAVAAAPATASGAGNRLILQAQQLQKQQLAQQQQQQQLAQQQQQKRFQMQSQPCAATDLQNFAGMLNRVAQQQQSCQQPQQQPQQLQPQRRPRLRIRWCQQQPDQLQQLLSQHQQQQLQQQFAILQQQQQQQQQQQHKEAAREQQQQRLMIIKRRRELLMQQYLEQQQQRQDLSAVPGQDLSPFSTEQEQFDRQQLLLMQQHQQQAVAMLAAAVLASNQHLMLGQHRSTPAAEDVPTNPVADHDQQQAQHSSSRPSSPAPHALVPFSSTPDAAQLAGNSSTTRPSSRKATTPLRQDKAPKDRKIVSCYQDLYDCDDDVTSDESDGEDDVQIPNIGNALAAAAAAAAAATAATTAAAAAAAAGVSPNARILAPVDAADPGIVLAAAEQPGLSSEEAEAALILCSLAPQPRLEQQRATRSSSAACRNVKSSRTPVVSQQGGQAQSLGPSVLQLLQQHLQQ